jgi:hypothetical protein
MYTLHGKLAFFTLLTAVLLLFGSAAEAHFTKGIYITQPTLENTKTISHLIQRAKSVGIDTFIVDMERPSQKYRENIQLLKNNNINYVARVVIFPNGGGTPEQVSSEAHWAKKYQLIKEALSLGAQQIQLDYIRYTSKQGPSRENAKNIFKVIRYYKERVNVPLQVDVFGIASFGESVHIGQNVVMFSNSVDVLCPMVYPSHYEPYLEHAVRPYNTVYSSLTAIKAQFNNKVPVKLVPYIELSNYRYQLSQSKKLAYIYAQIQAAEDAGADGWYAWSPHNQYENLFRVLETHPVK